MLGKTDVYLVILDTRTNKQFTKYFETEFNKDKYKRYLKYKGRYIILEDSSDMYFLD